MRREGRREEAMFRFVLTAMVLCLLAVPGSAYICGDANNDQSVNVGDAVYLIRYVFSGGPGPVDPEAGDANSDGEVNLADAVYLVGFIFKGGPEPCPTPPSGGVTGRTMCKMLADNGAGLAAYPPTCIVYGYDGNGTLNMTHTDALFNCCLASIEASFQFEPGRITVNESETYDTITGPCNCLCPYDVSFRISDLPPGTYIIRVDGPETEPIEFTVEFSSVQSSGKYCVEQPYSPSVAPEPANDQ
jgi:hypothetical protein